MINSNAQQENIWTFHAPNDPSKYLYEAVAEHVSQLITSGALPARSILPSERKLAKVCGVSLGTARHATEILRQRGFVVTVRSKGTYVTDTAARQRGHHDGSGLTLLNSETAS